jgi:hypothetical protein
MAILIRFLMAALLVACVPARGGTKATSGASPRPIVSAEEAKRQFVLARQRLDLFRSALDHRPFGETVQISLREEVSGRRWEGRGVVVRKPATALRLVLLGPGGATALDLWATPDRCHLESPLLGVRHRGPTASAPAPTPFLAWWFLDPLGQHVQDAWLSQGLARGIMEGPRGERTEVEETADGWVLRRRGGVERLSLRGPPGQVGTHVSYQDLSARVFADVIIEDIAAGPPSDEAFREPEPFVDGASSGRAD